MTNVEEYGLTNRVKIAPSTAKMMTKVAMKIVVSMAVLPKKSSCSPMTTSTIPINIQLSLNTFQILEASKTGHPYLDLP